MRLEVVSHVPETPTHKTPILFVHGAWHGAWCWEDNFLPYFAQKGYAAHALSLRGHGQSEGRERVRWASIQDYITDIVQVVVTLPSPPVIVAHSLGGFVAQKYLEHYDAPGVVLVAPAPAFGGWKFTLRTLRQMPLAMLESTFTLRTFPIVGTVQRAQAVLFARDLPREELLRHYDRLQDDSFLAYLDFLLLALPDIRAIRERGTPMLILGGKEDSAFPPKEIEALGHLYGVDVALLPNMAHDIMLDPRWQVAADRIISWLGETGIP